MVEIDETVAGVARICVEGRDKVWYSFFIVPKDLNETGRVVVSVLAQRGPAWILQEVRGGGA